MTDSPNRETGKAHTVRETGSELWLHFLPASGISMASGDDMLLTRKARTRIDEQEEQTGDIHEEGH